MQNVILSTAYLAPVQYYSKLKRSKKILIEQHDNYPKQTYRNRCHILAANGKLALSIPIEKDFKGKAKVRDIKISYADDWQKTHWKSIESAYKSSPFFEFIMDDLEPFYTTQFRYLLDFNMQIQEVILDFLELTPTITLTDDYEFERGDFIDFRENIHPKKENEDCEFTAKSYTQVFSNVHGFTPNLSILDLICNEGANSDSYL